MGPCRRFITRPFRASFHDSQCKDSQVMRLNSTRRRLLAFAAAPLALALAACGGDQNAAPTGNVIAKVAAPAGQKWEEMVTEGTDGGMVLGNPQAPLKLVEYGSLSCPHCAKFAQEGMQPLMHDFIASGRVSLEFRSFAIHPQDIPLTVLVRCAPKEAFFAMVEQIYTNFDALNAKLADKDALAAAEAAMKGPPATRYIGLSQALGYTDFFAARGLAAAQSNACLGNLETAKQVADYAKKYGEDGVTGTPTFKLNGALIDLPQGSDPWTIVQNALRNAGAR